ncbi:MAG: hypothetical protein KF716_09785 [Anaerolineae bacterium]|nr:hypothetical protein [Anaerolineae bacterium]
MPRRPRLPDEPPEREPGLRGRDPPPDGRPEPRCDDGPERSVPPVLRAGRDDGRRGRSLDALVYSVRDPDGRRERSPPERSCGGRSLDSLRESERGA